MPVYTLYEGVLALCLFFLWGGGGGGSPRSVFTSLASFAFILFACQSARPPTCLSPVCFFVCRLVGLSFSAAVSLLPLSFAVCVCLFVRLSALFPPVPPPLSVCLSFSLSLFLSLSFSLSLSHSLVRYTRQLISWFCFEDYIWVWKQTSFCLLVIFPTSHITIFFFFFNYKSSLLEYFPQRLLPLKFHRIHQLLPGTQNFFPGWHFETALEFKSLSEKYL